MEDHEMDAKAIHFGCKTVTELASKKRFIYLTRYSSGMYGVERITKSYVKGLKYFDTEEEAREYFNSL